MVASLLSPTVRRLRRGMLSGLGTFGIDSIALMLGVDTGRLRAELSNMRTASRMALFGLLIFIVCAIAGTASALIGIATSASVSVDTAEQAASDAATRVQRSYDAIVTRPLFSRSRQPAAAPVDSMGGGAVVDRQISLRGVFINGAMAKAFMLSPQTPLGVWRKRGEDFEGWRVEDVARDHVTLTSQAERLIVPLTIAGAGGR